jgi:UDP-N-acetylglucosamine--N-acetylmuramyl-(pentapeptide) pyrophosphoryl-undecaprenol N-acetylglucosamine transferase
MKNPIKIMISGGGTGGHVFPAIAIAQEVRKHHPEADILFVGALGRMEMEKVPQYGFSIKGLNISGIHRTNIWKNIGLPFKLLSSYLAVRKMIKDFKPDAVVGVGGYASGPLVFMASQNKIPVLLQEQNSHPGVTNKIAGKRANVICVAYDGLQPYFPNKKIVLTGNPVRGVFANLSQVSKEDAYQKFNLSPDKKTVLIIGGSLGARTINDGLLNNLSKFKTLNINILWQTGKLYYNDIHAKTENTYSENVTILPFIDDMPSAYSIADVIISRAGAISISELALIGKATILVPSPNVAADHQTKNAEAIASKNACIMVKDTQFNEEIVSVITEGLSNPAKEKQLGEAIHKLATPEATYHIYSQLMDLIK